MTREIYDNMSKSLENLVITNLDTGLNCFQVAMILTSFKIILNENLKLSQELEKLKCQSTQKS